MKPIAAVGILIIGGMMLTASVEAQNTTPATRLPDAYQTMQNLRQQWEFSLQREQLRRIQDQLQRQQWEIDRLKRQEFRRLPYRYTH